MTEDVFLLGDPVKDMNVDEAKASVRSAGFLSSRYSAACLYHSRV